MKIVLTLSFTLIVLLSATQAGDWPRWRGPDLNGISTETGWRSDWLDADPEIVWKATVGTGFSGMTVAGGRLYTIGNKDNTDTVFCFDAETGKEIWTHSYPCALQPKFYEGGPSSSPTIDGDAVYTISKEGHLFCFDAAGGEIRWSTNIASEFDLPVPGWGFAGSPFIQDDILFLNAGASGLALKKEDGALVWKSGSAESGYSTPLPHEYGGKAQLLVSSGRDYSAVDPGSGESIWSFKWLTRYGVNAADPIPAPGDHLFISSGYSKGCALLKLTANGPEEVWKSKDMMNQMNPCVFIDGHLYGVHGDQNSKPEFKCLELMSGKTVWSDKSLGAGGVMAADGKLIVLSQRGELVIAPASPDGFQPSARAQVLRGKSWTVPVLANGRIYCRNSAGDVACVDVRK